MFFNLSNVAFSWVVLHLTFFRHLQPAIINFYIFLDSKPKTCFFLSPGTLCEKTVSYCDILEPSKACRNGGTCVNQFVGSRCNCAPGFTGESSFSVFVAAQYH